MPRVPPPRCRRYNLGRHIGFASRAFAGRTPPSTLPHMPYLRTYIPEAEGSPFPLRCACCMYCSTKEKAQHGAAAPRKQWKLHRKTKMCLIGNTLHRLHNQQSYGRVSLSASCAARPSRYHLVAHSVRVKLCLLSATLSPVARLVLSPVLTVAVVLQSENVGVPTGYLPL